MALFIVKTYYVTANYMAKKRIVVIGLNHREQGHGTNEFRNVLKCLLEEHSGIQVIFEEWGFADWANPGWLTAGNMLAKERDLPWDLQSKHMSGNRTWGYTTRLRGLYREIWLSENLDSWLPNMLQLYDRNVDMWQRHIEDFDQVKWDHREGKPLPAGESLGLSP
jgi:hypothetical protein